MTIVSNVQVYDLSTATQTCPVCDHRIAARFQDVGLGQFTQLTPFECTNCGAAQTSVGSSTWTEPKWPNKVPEDV